MSAFTLDIKGQLNNMRLAESKALWPLFEAIVNSIQSIDDSPNKTNGKITITACRDNIIQTTSLRELELGKICSFTVTDNGTGLNSTNYRSFNTAYSTLKVRKGCKGIGRFLWLKAFDHVNICSVYVENGKTYKRQFVFSENGVEPSPSNTSEIDSATCLTEVTLCDFQEPYKDNCPLELDTIAKRIIEHCLLFFISGSCPEIILSDGISESINLNKYYDENIKDSLHQDTFVLKDHTFTIYHLCVAEGATSHELHLCANMQEVKSVDLKNHIPNLQKRIYTKEYPKGFFYVGYVTGSYLDSIVNTARTGFDFDEHGNNQSLFGTSQDAIISASVDSITTYLSDDLEEISKAKRESIDRFVEQEHPTYRYLLSKKPEVYRLIPAGLRPDELELELHKHVQTWEREIKKQGIELEQAYKEETAQADSTFHERFIQYWAGMTEINTTCLAEYVVRRKVLLNTLDDALRIQENGNFKKEDVIHSIICPMRHTSNDVSFEEMNLWIIDDRLAYHKYLASDKTLKSMPVIDSRSTKEPDIAIYDQAFAYSDSDDPLTTVTIVEFKKPDNDSKNPIEQVGTYIDLIKNNKKKKANGQSFSVTEGTIFRCYIVCDLTEKMRSHCKNAGLFPTADNIGYNGYHAARKAYIEVISYNKLLADARKRNQIFFDKLFSPIIDSAAGKNNLR